MAASVSEMEPEIPRVGCSMAAIERFVAALSQHAPGGSAAGLTTARVNELAMANLTHERRCAFTELLPRDAALVGEPNVFVSHAWGMPFDALVCALRSLDGGGAGQSTAYFWLDVLVNDQWAAPAREFSWWQSVFSESVARIGRTVVVLEWQRPLPLERIWCLWEMFCSLPPVRLELALPASSRADFTHTLLHDFPALAAKLCRVDLRGSDAFHGGSGPGSCSRIAGGCPAVAAGRPCPNDRAQILGAIEAAPGGVNGVTARVVAGLRDWMVRAARAELAALPESCAAGGAAGRACSTLQFSLAKFLWDCGRLEEAEPLLREQAAALRSACGPEAPETVAALEKLANILRVRGAYDEALALFREVLAARRRAHGDAHADTLAAFNNLGRLLEASGRAGDAEPVLREALASCRALLGERHPDALLIVLNLARLQHERGSLASAEELAREALAGCSAAFGDSHDRALVPMRDLADVLCSRGDAEALAEAAALNQAALVGLRRLLGSAHGSVLKTLRVEGRLLSARGEPARGAAALSEALAGLRGMGDTAAARRAARDLADACRAANDLRGAAEATAAAEALGTAS